MIREGIDFLDHHICVIRKNWPDVIHTFLVGMIPFLVLMMIMAVSLDSVAATLLLKYTFHYMFVDVLFSIIYVLREQSLQ